MGYDFTGGRISHFPIDFCMGLTTVQRKGAACDKADGSCQHRYFRNTRLLLAVYIKYARCHSLEINLDPNHNSNSDPHYKKSLVSSWCDRCEFSIYSPQINIRSTLSSSPLSIIFSFFTVDLKYTFSSSHFHHRLLHR